MAEVFAGFTIGDHGFQKPVAIKRLLPELASDQVFVERLIQEAKLLVGMQHGNIVSVLDLARDGDDVFLVMEFVDGPSLRQLLKSRGSRGLSLGTATYIVQAAAAGLEFAHTRPGGAIIHADISPSNLLLTTSGEVRVADFGIARREGGGYGVVEGKWAYMAPEQARGEPLTPRSDVFALGVVLYELICGAHPFGRQVTHEERDSEPMRVIPPRVVKPSIPHGIDAICMRALAHDPRDRYARMQQLIDAIVEERFSNQWREGASDLAQAIREVVPSANAPAAPRTMVTDRPVTIMTRSLLRELTPLPPQARRASSPSTPYGEGTPPPVSTSSPSPSVHVAYDQAEYQAQMQQMMAAQQMQTPQPRLPDSGANTNNMLAEEIRRAAALMEIPAAFRGGDGAPMPAFRFPQQQNQDLSQVVGGHTMTGSHHAGVLAVEPRSSLRWTLGILMAAAFIGVVAGLAIKMKSRDGGSDTTSNPVVAQVDNNKAQTQTPAPDQRQTDSVKTVEAPPAALGGPTVTERTPDSQEKANAGTPPPADTGAKGTEPPKPTVGEKKDNVTITDDKTEGAPPASKDTKDPKDTTVTESKDTKDVKDTTKDVKDTTKDTKDVVAKRTPPRDVKTPAIKQVAAKSDQAPGYVRIRTDPWGYATVPGQRVDTMSGKLTLSPGKHTVYVECADCTPKKSKVVTVIVKSEMTQSISIHWDEED